MRRSSVARCTSPAMSCAKCRRWQSKPIRASAPFQIWHLDLTVIRLIDGSRVFVQAVIDNFSRYVLAARTTATYGGSSTKTLLLEAIGKATAMGCSLTPTVMVDSGSENLNGETDGLVDTGIIKRVVAQIVASQVTGSTSFPGNQLHHL